MMFATDKKKLNEEINSVYNLFKWKASFFNVQPINYSPTFDRESSIPYWRTLWSFYRSELSIYPRALVITWKVFWE
jgi:hypothetical protein